ncbi:Pyridoxamine 5'-phosphate oxidase [hydrothermal vent metagenome]|uniref:Pyridoxamine 5'-phosphate oxidase n=1 Tax=hydrothermal vent metagenome TaxID=652676 RepID=A0A3B0X5G6_9ZZZZ
MTTLSDTRRQYDYSRLTRKQLNADPFKQMQHWLEQAKQAELKDATSMTLATSGENAMPDARIVLLKQLDEKGFSWYTSYASNKGQQLLNNPNACLLFYWRDFDRQVKVQGRVEKLSAEDAENYFHSRPLESQFSAAASQQSQAIDSRQSLEKKLQQLKNINANAVEKPDTWGGYRLLPSAFEFWQGRENRLHDRFTYLLDENGQWLITRLQP